MVTHAIDYAFARPAPAAIKAAGYTGVLRYVCPINDQTKGKVISGPEMAALRAAGLDVTLNFEWYETRPTKGYQAGIDDAHVADAQADALGYPVGCAIYYSVDFGATWGAVSEYFRGVHTASKRPVGVYGGIPIIRAAQDAGYARFGWVTNAASWSGMASWSVVASAVGDSNRYHLLQHLHSNTPAPVAGVSNDAFDPNTVLNQSYGQWSISGGTFMSALTDAEQRQMFNAIIEMDHNLMQGIGHSLVNDAIAEAKAAHQSAAEDLVVDKAIQATLAKLSPAASATIDKDALAAAVVAKMAANLAT